METVIERYLYDKGGVWTPINAEDALEGDTLRLVIDNVPILKENGTPIFKVIGKPFYDFVDETYRVPVQ